MGAKKSVYITPREPEIVLYENHPLYGILYNNALDEFVDLRSGEKEKTLTAMPFFYGVDTPNQQDLTYNWTIDSRVVIMPSNENDLTVRIPDGEGLSGNNAIYVEARNAKNLLQASYSQLFVRFGTN